MEQAHKNGGLHRSIYLWNPILGNACDLFQFKIYLTEISGFGILILLYYSYYLVSGCCLTPNEQCFSYIYKILHCRNNSKIKYQNKKEAKSIHPAQKTLFHAIQDKQKITDWHRLPQATIISISIGTFNVTVSDIQYKFNEICAEFCSFHVLCTIFDSFRIIMGHNAYCGIMSEFKWISLLALDLCGNFNKSHC